VSGLRVAVVTVERVPDPMLAFGTGVYPLWYSILKTPNIYILIMLGSVEG
jgi:hypothetical protein